MDDKRTDIICYQMNGIVEIDKIDIRQKNDTNHSKQ
jgi:hypothetical protein